MVPWRCRWWLCCCRLFSRWAIPNEFNWFRLGEADCTLKFKLWLAQRAGFKRPTPFTPARLLVTVSPLQSRLKHPTMKRPTLDVNGRDDSFLGQIISLWIIFLEHRHLMHKVWANSLCLSSSFSPHTRLRCKEQLIIMMEKIEVIKFA